MSTATVTWQTQPAAAVSGRVLASVGHRVMRWDEGCEWVDSFGTVEEWTAMNVPTRARWNGVQVPKPAWDAWLWYLRHVGDELEDLKRATEGRIVGKVGRDEVQAYIDRHEADAAARALGAKT